MTEKEKATDEWNRELARHVRGFKVSDLPMKVVMPCTWEDGRTVDFVQTIRVMPVFTKVLVGGVLQDRPTMIRVEKDYPLPMGWSYWEYAEKIMPGGTWSPLDMPNPRLYSMEGGLLSNPPEGGMAMELERGFKEALGCLWQIEVGASPSIPVNERRSRILELLDHHYSKGGNPTSFRDFIGELARNPMRIPPPPTEGSLLLESFGAERERLQDPMGLSMLLQEWLTSTATQIDTQPSSSIGGDAVNVELIAHDNGQVRSVSSQEDQSSLEGDRPEDNMNQAVKGKAPPQERKWPDLKTLALFLALRYEAIEDKHVYLATDEEASVLAKENGYVNGGSGKRLRRHFMTYLKAEARTAKGVRDTEALKRYGFVIGKLEHIPEALALAKKEEAVVRTRSH